MNCEVLVVVKWFYRGITKWTLRKGLKLVLLNFISGKFKPPTDRFFPKDTKTVGFSEVYRRESDVSNKLEVGD